jgi:preprotein translocase subunit SecB
MPDPQINANLYAIQPTFFAVREIHFVSHRPPSANDRIDQSSVRVTEKVSPFNEETKRLQVSLEAKFGFEVEASATPPPFSVKVVITAEFAISDAFPRDRVQEWAVVNAPFVIFPYLRERLYYITAQAGYPPILLPLLQIPTFKVEIARPAPPRALGGVMR